MRAVFGATHIGDFLAHAIFPNGPMRLVQTRANDSPAFAAYVKPRADRRFELFALLMIAADDHRIRRIDAFTDPRALAPFALPAEPD